MSASQQALLRKYGIRPVKRRGQNFLVDGNLARSIARDVLAVSGRVLELGAGGGALTVPLLAEGARVVCVEVDRKLCALLEAEHGGLDRFDLIEADLAKLDWEAAVAAAGPRPVIAGNLPYVLTSKVLFAAADLRTRISGAVFMVQKEVAERLVAAPGGKDYGILAVVLGSIFTIEVVRTVPPSVFWPKPEVESAVVRLVPGEAWTQAEFENFQTTVRTVFGQRRKKLRTILRSRFELTDDRAEALAAAAGVEPDRRPEQVDPAAYRRLAAAMARVAGGGTP